MTSRSALAVVLLASVGPGLLFAPVFGTAPLVLPLVVVAVTVYVVAELASRWPGLAPWRMPLALVAGLVGLVEALLWDTTVAGLPTATSVRALVAGVTDSWQLTLQSTWPARSDPELLLFVPLVALVAAVAGVELLERLRWPLIALLPGFAVLVLSQAYVALTGLTATAAGLGFAVLGGALLVLSRAEQAGRRGTATVLMVVPTLVLSVAGAALVGAFDPVERPASSLRQNQQAPLPPQREESPLDQIAARLGDPEKSVFSYTSDAPVDRWRLAVLDQFDGASWSIGAEFYRMGAELDPAPEVTSEVDRQHATVRVTGLDEQWLPSQAMPASVSGVESPRVDEKSGTLVAPGRRGNVEYELSWWDPIGGELDGAAIDRSVPVGDVGEIPPGIVEFARDAVHHMPPSLDTALLLERFLAEKYQVVESGVLPTGNGWYQLEEFLRGDEKEGTSEQFAAAYVALARVLGIPARVAVGFSAPEAEGDGEPVVVRNENVLAWPEVAVEGFGWVPLKPTPVGGVAGTGGGSDFSERLQKERESLPEPEDLVEPELEEEQTVSEGSGGGGFSFPLVAVALVVGAALLARLVGVPLARGLRAWRRRSRRGVGAVVGAWEEARDRLRAHGVPFTLGMTARDLAAVVPDPPVVAGLHGLARGVDIALWSPAGPGASTVDEAWSAVREVRRGLAARPVRARLRAALHVGSLFSPR